MLRFRLSWSRWLRVRGLGDSLSENCLRLVLDRTSPGLRDRCLLRYSDLDLESSLSLSSSLNVDRRFSGLRFLECLYLLSSSSSDPDEYLRLRSLRLSWSEKCSGILLSLLLDNRTDTAGIWRLWRLEKFNRT